MTRAQAVAAIASGLRETDRVIIANGAMGRELFSRVDNPRHFFLVGSMGLAASVGVGLALQRPDIRVVVLDGDGNLIMGLGGLLLAGGTHVKNLLHLVVDNGEYATTGRQPTFSSQFDLETISRASGYGYACSVDNEDGLKKELDDWPDREGPVFLRIVVTPGPSADLPRIPYTPEEMAARFIDSGE